MLPKPSVIQLLTHALAFVCPSVYEPLGIVNLEAMACGTAVVASRVGGIPEVVDDGVTGLLVPPDDPAALAEALNALVRDPARAAALWAGGPGARGRRVQLADGRDGHGGPVRGAFRRMTTNPPAPSHTPHAPRTPHPAPPTPHPQAPRAHAPHAPLTPHTPHAPRTPHIFR